MSKKTGLIIAILILVVGGIIGVWATNGVQPSYDYEAFDADNIIGTDEANGGFGDLIEGVPMARVTLIEYGNYQCTGCARLNSKINDLITEYQGDVVLVFRNTSLPEHDNGEAAAAAALAASKQGYWREYKDYLYANQADWYYATGKARREKFEEYLMTVSSGAADLKQFQADVKSKEVAQKIVFDEKMSERAGASFTPYFMIEGENISQEGLEDEDFLAKLRARIDEILGGE